MTFCVFFNFLLYFIPTLIYWKRKKCFDAYLMLLVAYMVTALLCFLYYCENPNIRSDIQLFPFIYLFGVLMLFFSPVKNFNMQNRSLYIIDNKYIRTLGCFFVIIGLLDIVTSYQNTVMLIQSGEWGDLRNQLYQDADEIALYSSPLGRLIKNLNSYLSPFALVYAFYQLTKIKINRVFTLFLFLSIIGPAFMSSTVVASRGMIVFLVMKLGITFLLFKDKIPEGRKKVIYAIAFFVLFIFAIYTFAVTISRFGESGDVGESLFFYFGHSMLFFNDGLFNSLYDYAWGKMFFAWFIDLLGGDSSFSAVKAGATHGTAFYTFVGGVFIDWGPLGTIIVALLAVAFIRKWFRKPNIYLSDTVMIVFYLSTLIQGLFAFGKGRALAWVMTYIVYLIIRKLETRKC